MTATESSSRTERFLIYAVALAVVIVLVAIGVVGWHSAASARLAQQKAVLLRQTLVAAGARVVPSPDQVVRVLGDDGGATCADPAAALSRATLLEQVATGSGGTGSRPVSAGSSAVRGELLIMSVYCPAELPAFQQFVDQTSLAGGG